MYRMRLQDKLVRVVIVRSPFEKIGWGTPKLIRQLQMSTTTGPNVLGVPVTAQY
jgi:hypothetical protein